MPSSSTAEKLASRLQELPEGSTRRKVLETARKFKSAWVELGALLVEVKRESLWDAWGYRSFESYCAKELFIRRQTAEKLVMSYGFLERHEPGMTRPPKGREPPPVPSFEVFEVLSRAEASGQLPSTGYQEIRDEIFDRSPTAAAVNRQLAQRFGAPPTTPSPASIAVSVAQLKTAAQRLAQGCRRCSDVPHAIVDRADALAQDLAQLAVSTAA